MMEELRLVVLTLLGGVFLYLNYRRRRDNHNKK